MEAKVEKKLGISLSNLIWFVGIIFVAGGAYTEFRSLQKEIERLELELHNTEKTLGRRLDKKIQVLSEHEEEIQALQRYVEYEKGLKERK